MFDFVCRFNVLFVLNQTTRNLCSHWNLASCWNITEPWDSKPNPETDTVARQYIDIATARTNADCTALSKYCALLPSLSATFANKTSIWKKWIRLRHGSTKTSKQRRYWKIRILLLPVSKVLQNRKWRLSFRTIMNQIRTETELARKLRQTFRSRMGPVPFLWRAAGCLSMKVYSRFFNIKQVLFIQSLATTWHYSALHYVTSSPVTFLWMPKFRRKRLSLSYISHNNMVCPEPQTCSGIPISYSVCAQCPVNFNRTPYVTSPMKRDHKGDGVISWEDADFNKKGSSRSDKKCQSCVSKFTNYCRTIFP